MSLIQRGPETQKDEAMHPTLPMTEPPSEPTLGLHPKTLLSSNTGALPLVPITTTAWLL